jgi:hypothetical protein
MCRLLTWLGRWLVAHDRLDEATTILSRLHGSNVSTDDHSVQSDLAEIKHAIDEEREAAAGNTFKALLKNGTQRFRFRTLLGIGGQFMQQLSGNI